MRIVTAFLCLLIVLSSATAATETKSVPRIFLIGDSTVRNGRADGAGGLWGWGDILAFHFDTNEVRVINRALGGRSSRTFLTEGLWQRVRQELRTNDFVLMQFGHNDGGEIARGDRPRASLRGNGDETKEALVEKTGKKETVHSYGWYLRRYIEETKAAGALPIVLSPVPRNIWRDGKVARAARDYGKWAEEAARDGGARFVDLNELIASRYESAGQATVSADYFTSADHTHTTRAGATVNAECVAMGLQGLDGTPFARWKLKEKR